VIDMAFLDLERNWGSFGAGERGPADYGESNIRTMIRLRL